MRKAAVLFKFYGGEISPFDESALECALLAGLETTVFALAPESALEKLRYYTRLGVHAVLVSDPAFAGSDTLVTARVLARALREDEFDLVLCGRQSLNGDTAQVPAEVAALLGYDFIPYVTGFSVTNPVTRLGARTVRGKTVMSLERIKVLRPASLFSHAEEVRVLSCARLGFSPEEVGSAGSPTRVIKTYERKKPRKRCVFIPPEQLLRVLRESLERQETPTAKSVTDAQKCQLAHYVGQSVRLQAENIAAQVVEIDTGTDLSVEEKAARVIAYCRENPVSVLLMPATPEYRAVAPLAAAGLGIGLCADCTALRIENDRLVMTRPALSGSTYAEIVSRSAIQAATVRTRSQSGELVFGIGYGAKDFIKEITDFAAVCGAEVVASRKMVDAGRMPYETQVGLTGRNIAPKVYVAFGISGAVQHLVGVENAQTVIAVNSDKDAPIFGFSDYGVLLNGRTV